MEFGALPAAMGEHMTERGIHGTWLHGVSAESKVEKYCLCVCVWGGGENMLAMQTLLIVPRDSHTRKLLTYVRHLNVLSL